MTAATVAVTEEMVVTVVATAAEMVATAEMAEMAAVVETAAKVGLPRIARRIRWLSR